MHDNGVTDRTEERIQTSDFVGTVTEGTKDDLWSLKAEEKIDGKIEVGYVYPKLSDAFKDQNIGIFHKFRFIINNSNLFLCKNPLCRIYTTAGD